MQTQKEQAQPSQTPFSEFSRSNVSNVSNVQEWMKTPEPLQKIQATAAQSKTMTPLFNTNLPISKIEEEKEQVKSSLPPIFLQRQTTA